VKDNSESASEGVPDAVKGIAEGSDKEFIDQRFHRRNVAYHQKTDHMVEGVVLSGHTAQTEAIRKVVFLRCLVILFKMF
jgi:hypothetical protein